MSDKRTDYVHIQGPLRKARTQGHPGYQQCRQLELKEGGGQGEQGRKGELCGGGRAWQNLKEEAIWKVRGKRGKRRAFQERQNNTFRDPEDRTYLSPNWAWGAEEKVVEEDRINA